MYRSSNGTFIGTREAPRMVGCSTVHLRNLIQRGLLPATRVGGPMARYRIRLEDVQEFTRGRPVVAPSESVA